LSVHESAKEIALKVLYERAISGNHGDFSLTAPKIRQKSGYTMSPSVFVIYLDELIKEGMVSQPRHGVSDRYQITSDGIRWMDRLNEQGRIDSSSWTGIITPTQVSQIFPLILKMEFEAEKITDNAQRSQIIGIVAAIKVLLDLPQPPAGVVVQALRDPIFSNLVQFATLIAAIVAALRTTQ